MANNLPRDLAKTIKEKIHAIADEAGYACMARTESGAFLDRLSRQKDIGGVIEQHMPRAAVRTYIKDGVLNAYSKAFARRAKPDNMEGLVTKVYGQTYLSIETGDKLEIFRSKEKPTNHVVAASGTFVKWETALRKALLCVASMPFGKAGRSQILLVLFAQGKAIAPADKTLLLSAIERCDAKAVFLGE